MEINQLINVAVEAGKRLLLVYEQPMIEHRLKNDGSLVTEADRESHKYISTVLTRLYPSIPIISEESAEQIDYETRKKWEQFFLIDPLDGTKEFIKRNGEFTVNVALIQKNKPTLGVIHAPALNITYYAEKTKGAYKIENNHISKLSLCSKDQAVIRVVTSRSHRCEKTKEFLNTLISNGKEVMTTDVGSALKFGLIADGSADIYPRLAPTMEWDTAAGQAIVNEVGKNVFLFENNEHLQYNKKTLVNPGFIVR